MLTPISRYSPAIIGSELFSIFEEFTMSLQWLAWAKQLQAIAQTGLHYGNHAFDIERYEKIQQIAAEMIATHTGVEPTLVLDMFQQEWGHATPKVDVRGVAFRDDQVLLVKERSDGCWTLPGGWADIGEPPSRAVEREVFEESGFEAKATKLLAVYERDHPRHGHPPEPHHSFKLFFHCEIVGGSAQTSNETSDVGFFGPDQIPPLSLGRVVPSQIARFFEHRYHPDWPTDFD
jgi:ADP-ribose pyrophosphatase YjhB (NUDIX family)